MIGSLFGRWRGMAASMAILLLGMLSGCTFDPQSLPPNYRTRIALNLALDYERDARGPAEISTSGGPGPQRSLTGAPVLFVRYPVEASYQIFTPGRIVPRCITVTTGTTITGQSGMSMSRQRTELEGSCRPERDWTRFTELESVVLRIRACRVARQARCIVSDPGAPIPLVFNLRLDGD